MKNFYLLLVNGLLTSLKNNFVWFALTFWIFLTTKSVVSTSILSGSYLVAAALSNFWFGSLVDHHKKKNVMMFSGLVSLVCFSVGWLVFTANPGANYTNLQSPLLWVFSLILLVGVVFGNIYGIAIPTLVPIMAPKNMIDKANGMVGMTMGLSFTLTSVFSGVSLAYLGIGGVLVVAIVANLATIGHLMTVKIQENKLIHLSNDGMAKKIDVKGTLRVIRNIPGLWALIFYATFNNLLGGVFMSLMDAYGLSLMPVQTWGFLWGILGLGFMAGGFYVSKKGVGGEPLRNLFRVNKVMWLACIFFTIQPSIPLLIAGCLVWTCLSPFIEAAEQTILQKVVPQERMGRVMGLASSIEQAASPLTAFMIGPLAEWLFIPFMTTGAGVGLIGDWFGTGMGRGIALVFMAAGTAGFLMTTLARRSKPYVELAEHYKGI